MNPEPQPPTGFVDPYAHLPEAPDLPPGSTADCVIQAAVKFSNRDRALLQSVHFARPTIRITVAILIHRLCHELRKHGITEYDPNAYERAVGGLTIALGGTASTAVSGDPDVRSPASDEQPNRQATDGDDGRGTPRVPCPSDGSHPESPNAAESCQGPVAGKTKRATRVNKGHKQV